MSRADIERAVDEELARGSFYHASDKPLPIGVELVSHGSMGYTPEIIDDTRPKGVRPRNDHLFMFRNDECLDELGVSPYYEYVYQVTPTSPVTKTNFGWLKDIVGPASYPTPEAVAALPSKGWYKRPFKVGGGGQMNFWTRDGKTPHTERNAVAYEFAETPGKNPCMAEYLTMSFRVDDLVSEPRKGS